MTEEEEAEVEYARLLAAAGGEAKASTDRSMYPRLSEPLRSTAIHAHDALHTLWSKAPRDKSYDKRQWQNLANTISELVRLANGDK